MEYVRPSNIDGVISALDRFGDGAKVLAGGQSMLAMMKQVILQPDAIVSLAYVDELKGIHRNDQNALVIGSMATHRQVMTDPLVIAHVPILAEAARRVASAQIRNMGTWGGNLSHGEPGADPPAALIAVGAEVEIKGPESTRQIPVEDFFVDYLTTDLAPQEILTRIVVPQQPEDNSAVYIKHTGRDDGDLAIVGIGVRLVMDMQLNIIREVRIGINGASLTALRARAAEQLLQGKQPSLAAFMEAGEAAAAACDPLDDAEASAEYRLHLVKVLVKRALEAAVTRIVPDDSMQA